MAEGNNCRNCGKCCNYVAIELDTPEDEQDLDHFRWYLAHENVIVFIDDDESWNIQFNTRCKYLDENNYCGRYHDRFCICKNYDANECESANLENPLTFTSVEELEEFLKIWWPKQKKELAG